MNLSKNILFGKKEKKLKEIKKKIEEERFKLEEERFKLEEERFKLEEEICRIKEERSRLFEERDRIDEERNRLKEERSRLEEERHRLVRIKTDNFRYQVKNLIKQSRDITIKNFKKKSNYETVFIDFRIFDHVEFLIRNVIYKFDENWCHTVVCGNNNYQYMKTLCESISKNIKIIKLDIDNLNQETYSNLLQTTKFWNLFDSEKIFLYQEDSIVFKNNIEDFLEYDFIGAPWNSEFFGSGVNGGCALRTREVMLKCLENEKPYFPEDVYFCKTIEKYNLGKLPKYNISKKFGEEQINTNDIPFCGHQFWLSGNKKLENLKEIKCFEYLIKK